MIFHAPSEIDWTKFSLVIAAVIIVWTGLESVIPEPYHDKLMIVLAAIQSGIVFMMRSSKKPSNGGGK